MRAAPASCLLEVSGIILLVSKLLLTSHHILKPTLPRLTWEPDILSLPGVTLTSLRLPSFTRFTDLSASKQPSRGLAPGPFTCFLTTRLATPLMSLLPCFWPFSPGGSPSRPCRTHARSRRRLLHSPRPCQRDPLTAAVRQRTVG